MNAQQKGTILTLLKIDERNRDYQTRYWFSYKDYLDTRDCFTDFACEELDGKQGYIDLIEKLLQLDKTARVYVEVYGLEEIDGEPMIHAETLIIVSRLSLDDMKKVFYEPDDIFPSDIGEERDFSRPFFLVGSQGELIPGETLLGEEESVYYCWWD